MRLHVSLLSVLVGFLFFGCCAMTPDSSSSCPYGTYGSACAEFCEKSKGTQFDGGPTCFSDCMSIVKKQGFGDSTTCCKENVRQGCRRSCSESLSQIYSQYEAKISDEEKKEELELCIKECTAPYEIIGVNIDSFCYLLETY